MRTMSRLGSLPLLALILLACQSPTSPAPKVEEVEEAATPTPTEVPVAAEDLAPTGFVESAPRVGEPAPDFELKSITGDTVHLQAIAAKSPTVLVFGSYS